MSDTTTHTQGDGGPDKGTGLYPMPKPVERTQETDNTSTMAFTGYTDPKTYEGPTDNSSTGVVTGRTDPTTHHQWPAVATEAPPKAKAEPEKRRQTGGKN